MASRWLVANAESDLQRHLPVFDLRVFDAAARLDDVEPIQMLYAFAIALRIASSEPSVDEPVISICL
jgi:hypothetical protein